MQQLTTDEYIKVVEISSDRDEYIKVVMILMDLSRRTVIIGF